MDMFTRIVEGILDVQTLIGIGVSVFFFLIGYRQTVGARKERAHAANLDIEKTLVKRVVLESYKPSLEELGRLIEGKARDYRVKISDIHSESQQLNTVFTRIMETDFITPEERAQVLSRLSPLLDKADESPINEARVIELTIEKTDRVKQLFPLIFGVLSALAGSLVAFVTTSPNVGKLPVVEILIVFTSSLFLIGTLLLLQRLREGQEESGNNNSFRVRSEFEAKVVAVLKKFGATIHLVSPNAGADFFTEVNGKKILLEIKNVSRHFPMTLLRNTVNHLKHGMETYKADEGIIVTRGELALPTSWEESKIRILSIRGLSNYLASIKNM